MRCQSKQSDLSTDYTFCVPKFSNVFLLFPANKFNEAQKEKGSQDEAPMSKVISCQMTELSIQQ